MTQGWQIKNIYFYLVCFVTLMMLVFGLITFLGHTARLMFPTEYTYYTTIMEVEREYLNTNREVPAMSELERIRDERRELELARSRAYVIRDLINSLAVWLIATPFYLYHWRKIKATLHLPIGVDQT